MGNGGFVNMNNNNISIGTILKNMRTVNTNFSQKQLGKKLSLSDTTISSYERENSQPDFQTILQIANICNYDIYSFDKKTQQFISLDSFSQEL